MAANDEMLRDHQETWHGFVRLTVIASAVIALVLAGMAIFLV